MTNDTIYIIYGSVGEDEDFESWEAAAYNEKKLAESHRDYADKYLKQIDPEDLPETTPFDDNFSCCHYYVESYSNEYNPFDLVCYFIGTLRIWEEKDLLKAIGKSWKGIENEMPSHK